MLFYVLIQANKTGLSSSFDIGQKMWHQKEYVFYKQIQAAKTK